MFGGFFQRPFQVGDISGFCYYDDRHNLTLVNASKDDVTITVRKSDREGNNSGAFSVYPRVEGKGGFSVSGVTEKDGTIKYHFNRVEPRLLHQSIPLVEMVGFPFLKLFGVNEIIGETPNKALARLIKRRWGAEITEYQLTDDELTHYRTDANKGLVDSRFIGKDNGYLVKVKIP